LVQLGVEVDKKILFPKEYPYTSSTTKILRENFAELADEVNTFYPLNAKDLIIDIGSNDGNLLSNFKKYCKILGITPENIAKIAINKGIPTIQDYFTKELSLEIIKKYGKAKIITATNVFAHMDNILKLLLSIKKLMKKDGIFITESHYLCDLINENQYDTIYHEHLRYYSLLSLKFLFEKFGLEIIRAKKIKTHGGSIRVYAALKGVYKKSTKLKLIYNNEKKFIKKNIFTFSKKVFKSKLDLYKILSKLKNNNNKIYGISAPSRATTLANYVGLNKDIVSCILEIDGSQKINHFLPGTNIPIFNEKKLYKDNPEYVLIFSWHIADEIIINLKSKGYKGKFIVPLPKPKIIN
jgi:SAM-dependent methyltransferase